MEQAIILTLLGMGTVMIVLYVINLMIVLIGKLLTPKTKKTLTESVPVPQAVAAAPSAGASEEMIVAAMAAIAICTENPNSGISVAPYRTSLAWASASRSDNTKKIN